MPTSPRIGLIAEDETDCDTIRVFIRRMLEADGSEPIGVSRRYGKGCGKMRRKAAAWMDEFIDEGCTALVLVHDLDRDPVSYELNDEAALRTALDEIASPPGVPRLICIPVEELEAWFWSDANVLRRVGPDVVDDSRAPHTIKQPKEELGRLSAKATGKHRYSTNRNTELAELLDLQRCTSYCPAFRELRDFVLGLVPGRALFVIPDPVCYQVYTRELELLAEAGDSEGHLMAAVEDLISPRDTHVVEIGCGTGWMSARLVARGATLTGVDNAEAMLDLAMHRLTEHPDAVEFRSGDAYALPMTAGIAGAVIANGVLGPMCVAPRTNWKQSVHRIVNEMERVAQPGAVLVVIESLGLGGEKAPVWPEGLADMDGCLHERGFVRTLLRTDYRFASVDVAVTVVQAVFGGDIVGRVRGMDRGIVPAHSALWSRRLPA